TRDRRPVDAEITLADPHRVGFAATDENKCQKHQQPSHGSRYCAVLLDCEPTPSPPRPPSDATTTEVGAEETRETVSCHRPTSPVCSSTVRSSGGSGGRARCPSRECRTENCRRRSAPRRC